MFVVQDRRLVSRLAVETCRMDSLAISVVKPYRVRLALQFKFKERRSKCLR